MEALGYDLKKHTKYAHLSFMPSSCLLGCNDTKAVGVDASKKSPFLPVLKTLNFSKKIFLKFLLLKLCHISLNVALSRFHFQPQLGRDFQLIG